MLACPISIQFKALTNVDLQSGAKSEVVRSFLQFVIQTVLTSKTTN